MTTRDTIMGYFDRLRTNAGWESLLADDISFTSFTSPVRRLVGKVAFLPATKRFYSTIVSFEVRDLIVDGNRACAFTHYELKAPAGAQFGTDVAEVFVVANDRITSFEIYFDSAPYPK